ncbi:MAG: hypothetical protein IT431_14625 [Phycisphaerales bacterium]|nr:hypothetical protein [Phycisphaerales bacterium]
MTNPTRSRATAALVVAAAAAAAHADFSGQTILGPLSNGSFVISSTAGASDDNDGFTSGGHIFDIWDGGDEVWQIDWTGGNLTLNLTSLNGSDNDLFLYTPASYDDSGNYSAGGSFDTVTEFGAAPGIYYAVIDSTFFSEGDYTLEVVPAPSSAAALGLAALGLCRRRR